MRSTFARRTVRSPWIGWPLARTGYDRSVHTFMGPVGFLITLLLVLLVGLAGWSGWFIVGWIPILGWSMGRNRREVESACEEYGHVPYQPVEGVPEIFCACCDQPLGPATRYVSTEVAMAAAEVRQAQREGSSESQAKWSNRR